MLKFLTDVQVVEQGAQLWIFRTKGASESSELMRDFRQHYSLFRAWRRQPFNPYSGAFAFELPVQVFIAKHPSVGMTPTGGM